MTKIIYNKFDKSHIAELPRVTFPGRIVVIQNVSDADKAVQFLLAQDILGVDTETRPVFKKGQHHKVALLQVSTHDLCFLFRLNIIGLPKSVISLLEDTRVPKIGLSWHDDNLGLQNRAKFKSGLFIDLQDMVKDFGIQDLSLQKLYANIFHERITKREQLSNWEDSELSQKQQLYAATDAWTCIKLYEEFNRLKQTGDYQIITVKSDVQENISKAG